MDPNSPAITQGMAKWLFRIILYGDMTSIGPVLRLIPDINSADFLKWLSPAHQIVSEMSVYGIRDSDRYLITHGVLKLHIVAAEEPILHRYAWPYFEFSRFDVMCGHTPTSMAMGYSTSFFYFRKLLIEEGFDIEMFIDDELAMPILAEEGWTRETLRFLFEVDFRPMKDSVCNTNYCLTIVLPADDEWLSALQELRSCNIQKAEELFAARDQHLLDMPSSNDVLCKACSATQARKGRQAIEGHEVYDDLEDHNSPFLLSI